MNSNIFLFFQKNSGKEQSPVTSNGPGTGSDQVAHLAVGRGGEKLELGMGYGKSFHGFRVLK